MRGACMAGESGRRARRAHAADRGAQAGRDAARVGPPDADAAEGRGAARRAGGGGGRGAARARTDARLADWLAGAAGAEGAAAVNVAEAARVHARAMRVPARLAAEIARVTWRGRRPGRRRARRPTSRLRADAGPGRRAQARGGGGLAGDGALYDALLDDYEPGATAALLDALFGRLRPRLVALRERIRVVAAARAARRQLRRAAQLALSRRAALAFGYDWAHGRIDKAVHPFSSGSGLDVRITTRVDEADPFKCFFSTIHEVGHAVYEQGIDRGYACQPVGGYASMGVHESQSRGSSRTSFGRSRAFSGWLRGGCAGVRRLRLRGRRRPCRGNRVHPGFIRTEADEVHYNLHMLMRYDLERAMLRASSRSADLRGGLERAVPRDFGQAVPDARRAAAAGCALGGRRPSATFRLTRSGNVYAGWLDAALRREFRPRRRAGDGRPRAGDRLAQPTDPPARAAAAGAAAGRRGDRAGAGRAGPGGLPRRQVRRALPGLTRGRRRPPLSPGSGHGRANRRGRAARLSKRSGPGSRALGEPVAAAAEVHPQRGPRAVAVAGGDRGDDLVVLDADPAQVVLQRRGVDWWVLSRVRGTSTSPR